MTSFQRCGSKNGLIGALIERRARSVTTTLEAVVSAPGEPREILQSFAVGLLGLLLGDESVALNRAAMSDPDLAGILLEGGRYTAGPIVEEYLRELAQEGHIEVASRRRPSRRSTD
jgi:hypothetical protein